MGMRLARIAPVGAAVMVLALAMMPPAAVGQRDTTEPTEIATPGAILQGLDKVTARISTFSAPIDQDVRFGTLNIRVRTCYKTPPTEPPEATAFLEITDMRPGEPAKLLFSGWMFASSPALSALEHPVYDVWVVDCMKPDSSSSDKPG